MHHKRSWLSVLAGIYLMTLGLFALPHTMWFHGQKMLSSMAYQALTEKEGALKDQLMHGGSGGQPPSSQSKILREFETLIINFKIKFLDKIDFWAISASILGLATSVFFIIAGFHSMVFAQQAPRIIYYALASYLLLLVAIGIFLSSLVSAVLEAGGLVAMLAAGKNPGVIPGPPPLMPVLFQPSLVFLVFASVIFYIITPFFLAHWMRKNFPNYI